MSHFFERILVGSVAVAFVAVAFLVRPAPAHAECSTELDLKGTWYWHMAWSDEAGAYNQGTFPNEPWGLYSAHADIGTEACKVRLSSAGRVVPSGSSCVYSDNRDERFFDIGFVAEKVVGGSFAVSTSCVVSGRLALEAGPDEGSPDPYIYFVRLTSAQMDSQKSTIGFTAAEWYADYLGSGPIWGTYSYQGTMIKRPEVPRPTSTNQK